MPEQAAIECPAMPNTLQEDSSADTGIQWKLIHTKKKVSEKCGAMAAEKLEEDLNSCLEKVSCIIFGEN